MTDTASTSGTRSEQVLEFWLGPESSRDHPDQALRARWYRTSPEFDAQIGREFGADIERAGRGELDAWGATPRGKLALVILLDQWSRNVGRGSGRMFQYDAKALAVARACVDAGEDLPLKAAERQFLYMPFMHSEGIADQRRSLELFERLAREAPQADVRSFAQAHHDIVARFGRFPHRNAWLGRTSTPEEAEFLTQPNSSF